jgi:hypothetical protein
MYTHWEKRQRKESVVSMCPKVYFQCSSAERLDLQKVFISLELLP